PASSLPRVQDDVIAGAPQQADHITQALGVDPPGEHQAVVDVQFQRLERAAHGPRRAGPGRDGVGGPRRPAALPAPPAAPALAAALRALQCAFDVGGDAADALGDLDVRVQRLVLLEDFVITRYVEQMRVLLEQPLEHPTLALALGLSLRHECDSTTRGV